MKLWNRWAGHWRRWRCRRWALGVDDAGDSVRWVCLRHTDGVADTLIGAGQWPVGAEAAGLVAAGLQDLPMALSTHAVVQRHRHMPLHLDENDHVTWAQATVAQAMGLSVAEVAADWGPEAETDPGAGVWVAGVRASVQHSRVHWAQARGAPLRLLDAQSSALMRVLCASAQKQTEPVWLWWAGRNEGHVCTGWWHLGRWHDRQDVRVDLCHMDRMPSVLLNLVKTAQAQTPQGAQRPWWWLGDALAPWAERWALERPASCRDWVCCAAPVPFGREIEALTRRPAHGWALALGLALHPGWRS